MTLVTAAKNDAYKNVDTITDYIPGVSQAKKYYKGSEQVNDAGRGFVKDVADSTRAGQDPEAGAYNARRVFFKDVKQLATDVASLYGYDEATLKKLANQTGDEALKEKITEVLKDKAKKTAKKACPIGKK